MRSVVVLAIGLASACTEKNPAYCESDSSCPNGTYCDLDLHSCIPEHDAGIADAGTATDASATDAMPFDCSAPIACPTPGDGKLTLCGYVLDAESGERIQDDGADGTPCEPDSPATSGPCSLELLLYDGLAFAENPLTAPHPPADEVVVDTCGRFRAVNIEPPALGYIAVATDDASASSADDYVLTVVSFAVSMAGSRNGLGLYSARRATDQRWTDTAGNPFGLATFSERGAHMSIFLDVAAPVAGVRITVGDATVSDSDFYFADADGVRSTVNPTLDVTLAPGAGLTVGTALTNYSGVGGEPSGCAWPATLGFAVAGALVVQEQRAACP